MISKWEMDEPHTESMDRTAAECLACLMSCYNPRPAAVDVRDEDRGLDGHRRVAQSTSEGADALMWYYNG